VERARLRRDADPHLRHPSPGTELAIETARRLGRPLYTFHAGSPEDVGMFRRWLQVYRVRTLNVAGPRESEAPGHCSIYPLLGRVLNISFHPQGAKDLKSGGLAVNLCLVPQRHVLFTASESTRHHLQYLIRRYVVQHCNASIPPTMSQSAADDDDW
jgi:hypothetical protein